MPTTGRLRAVCADALADHENPAPPSPAMNMRRLIGPPRAASAAPFGAMLPPPGAAGCKSSQPGALARSIPGHRRVASPERAGGQSVTSACHPRVAQRGTDGRQHDAPPLSVDGLRRMVTVQPPRSAAQAALSTRHSPLTAPIHKSSPEQHGCNLQESWLVPLLSESIQSSRILNGSHTHVKPQERLGSVDK